MNSENSCGKSSAIKAEKALKGFTLVELLIVIAIIAVLAGISSILITGFVRDANIETADNKAEQVYTAVQNMLIQFELNQDYSSIDARCVDSTYDANAKYIRMAFKMDNGSLKGSDVTLYSDSVSTGVSYGNYTFPGSMINTTPGTTPYITEKRFREMAKYLTDSLASDFSGFAYVSIDMENYTVDSVVFSEDNAVTIDTVTNGTYAKRYTQKSGNSLASVEIYGCESIMKQKEWYKSGDSAGVYVGYYPMINDLPSGTIA